MDAKEVVQIAKEYIQNLYQDETIKNIGLEEITFDGTNIWYVTIGFSRP